MFRPANKPREPTARPHCNTTATTTIARILQEANEAVKAEACCCFYSSSSFLSGFFSLYFVVFFFRSCIFSLTRSRRSSDGSFFCYRLPLALFLFDFQKNVTACHVISSGSVALVNTIRLSPRDPSSKTFVGMAPADRYRKQLNDVKMSGPVTQSQR